MFTDCKNNRFQKKLGTVQYLLKGRASGKQGRARTFFSRLKGRAFIFYVITKGRAATFSDIEIFR
jgi:hypothetical protein